MDTYKKNKGNAGLKGVQFQLNLLSVCLLNALRSYTEWRISIENPAAGKYDDIVVELPDQAILVQAKHKENRKIDKEQLLSINPKHSDFSLAKYFFSYVEIKKKFKNKVVVICSNTDIDKKDLEDVLTFHEASPQNMLQCGGNCKFFTFNEKIVPELEASANAYLDKNLKGKGFDKKIVSDENLKEFLHNLQIFSNYPSEEELHKVIGQLLSSLTTSSLWRKTSSQEVYKKVEDWFLQPKGEYLTEFRTRALFCEIKSDKYCEFLRDINISFERNDLKFPDSKRILHIATNGVHLVQTLKIYYTLQNDGCKKLYANPSDDIEVQRHVVEAFELPRYVFLVMIWSRITQGTLIKEIGDKLKNILKKSSYKKIILIGENNNILAQQIGLTDISQVNGCITFKDLSKTSQEKLLKDKTVNFQGKTMTLGELLQTNTINDYGKSLDSEVLDQLVKEEVVKVGVRLLDLKEDVARYYISRRFDRSANFFHWPMRRLQFSEEGILHVNEKLVLISDCAGAGKSTVLVRLAVTLKDKHPHLWIIKINLNDYTGILKKHCKKGINITELLDEELTNPLEKFVFFLKEKVVLMLDAVDEVSPDYTQLIIDLLTQCQGASNFAKIFVATRPHMTSELEAKLRVKSFKLFPFAEYNQIDFLTRYWTYNLQLTDNAIKKKCEQYAKILITKIYSLVEGFYWENEFAAIPLLLRMLGEIFQDNVREHLDGNSVELKLSEKFMAQLYDVFIERQRDIYIEKGNPSGNSAANHALNEHFQECLADHRCLALKTILSETERNLFMSCHRDLKDMARHMLKLGVVEKSSENFKFKHRTFAEYFVADTLIKELQLPNPGPEFQKFLINEILLKNEYKVVRSFFDSFLQKIVNALAPSIFENYCSTSDAWTSKDNLIFTLTSEGCSASLKLLWKIMDFKSARDRKTDIKHILDDLDSDWVAEIDVRNEKGDTPLHVAIKEGHLEMAKELIERGADTSARDCTGRPALHLLAERGKLDVIKFLVKRGVDVNLKEMCGRSALYLAAVNNYLEITKYLVECGGDLNIRGTDGRTVLHTIVTENDVDTVKYFLKHGVDINARDNMGRTALHLGGGLVSRDMVQYFMEHGADINLKDSWGCTQLHGVVGNLGTVKILVESGVDVNIKNDKGRTPLHEAARGNLENTIKYLLEHNADAKITDNDGSTALHLAANFKSTINCLKYIAESGINVNLRNNKGHTVLHIAVTDDRFDVLEYVMERNGDVNIRDNDGYTVLHLVVRCRQNKLNFVKRLIERGAEINATDNLGRTALHYAARNGLVDTIELLRKHSLKVDIKDSSNRTALHYAAESYSMKAVEYFVRLGIKVDAVDNEGYTAIHLAADKNCMDIVKYLVDHGADPKTRSGDGRSTLHFAAKQGNVEFIKYLVECGIDPNTRDSSGRTALHVAANHRNEEIVSYLVKIGVNVNVIDNGGHTALRLITGTNRLRAVMCLVDAGTHLNIKGADGRTALHLAAERDEVNIINYLVEKGADVNLKDNDGYAALHLIAKRDKKDAVPCLAEHDADLNIRNNDGHSALHFVALRGKEDTLKCLVEHKADVDITDNDGRSPLHVLTERELVNLVKFLVDHEADTDVRDNYGHTVLHLGVWYDFPDIVKYFLEHDANVNVKDNTGSTALHLAAELGRVRFLKFLTKCGADRNITDKNGHTALDLAIQFGCVDSAKYLTECNEDARLEGNKPHSSAFNH